MKYPYLVLALFVIFGAIDIAIIGNRFELTKADWSGWVQAIGSVAALGVAIFVMARQNAHSARLMAQSDLRAMTRRAAAVSALVLMANQSLTSMAATLTSAANGADTRHFHRAWTVAGPMLRRHRDALADIPAHELGSFYMVLGLHQIIETLSLFNTFGADWEVNAHSVMPPHDCIPFFENCKKLAAEATTTFEKGVRELQVV